MIDPTSNLPASEPLVLTAQAPPFRPRTGTFIVLAFLLLIWPGVSMLLYLVQDEPIDFDKYDPVLFVYIPTMVILWLILLAVLLALWREQEGLAKIGLGRPRFSHLGQALLFLLLANPILYALEWLLSRFGLPLTTDVEALVAKGADQVWWWLALSVTAAVCEEITFRGYLMTRLKYFSGEWKLPVILSALSFAAGHLYQGMGGFILILLYGAMFGLLFIRTGSLWPGIIAHFIQDFSAIFLYDALKKLGP